MTETQLSTTTYVSPERESLETRIIARFLERMQDDARIGATTIDALSDILWSRDRSRSAILRAVRDAQAVRVAGVPDATN
jgi:hypothetical protein